ncbi:hypothetical protein [Nocardia amamiensis]|uniref:hypothetical protein n=1 Tax=Nocardia amamiensis TaxID=404578 RepID=UPI00082D2A8A|nr:hypothetical protein [Nocardia amamiensis]
MDNAVSSHPTALKLIDDTIREIYWAEAKDTEAVLLSGWNGFTMLATAVMLLVEHWPDPDEIPDWYMFARNHNHAACAVAVRYLEKAPGLPPTDRTPQSVSGWATREDVSDQVPVPYDIRLWTAEQADPLVEVFGSQLVASCIPKLSLALNLGLSAAIPHTTGRADRKALTVGVAMSAEICDCWEGRLRTYFRTRKDLERTAAGAGERKRATEQLQRDHTLVRMLRDAVARSAGARRVGADGRGRVLAPRSTPTFGQRRTDTAT